MKETNKHAPFFCLRLFDGGAASAGAGDAGAGNAGSGDATGATADTGAVNTGDQVIMDAEKARREEFDRLIRTDYKDLYAENTQKLIDRRFKQTKELEDKAQKTAPILERLAAKYGESDPEKLLSAIDDDDSYYEAEAVERGMTVEQLKQFKKIERENAAFKQASERQQQQEYMRETYGNWVQQGEDLKQIYPSFDLETESHNDDFLKMLQVGIPVKAAYEALHMDEIVNGAVANATQKAKEAVVNDIRTRGMRPVENGLSSNASSVTKLDIGKMTKADREALEKRALRGEIVEL